jgi:tetratricopeptide (TPR) repeat protein
MFAAVHPSFLPLRVPAMRRRTAFLGVVVLLALPGHVQEARGQDLLEPGLYLIEALRARDGGRADSLEAVWADRSRRDPGDRLARLGLAGLARVTSRYARADSLLEALGARELRSPWVAESVGSPPDPVVLWAAVELAEGLRMRGRFLDADPLFRAADAWAVELGVPALEGRTALGRASWYARAGPRDSVGVHLDRLEALGERADPWIRSIMRCQGVIALPGRAGDVRGEVEAAAAAALAEGFPHLAADCQATLHRRFLAEGNPDSALAVMGRMEALSRASGDPITLSALLERRAILLFNVGAFGRATQDAHESVRLGRVGGNLSAAAWSLLHLALVHRSTGELDAALEALAEARELFEAQGDETGRLVADRRRAQVDAVAGRHEDAVRRLQELRPRARELMGAADDAFVQLDILDVTLAAGQHARADSLLPSVRDALSASGNAGWIPGMAWRETAIALGKGDLPRARDGVARDLAGVDVPSQRYLALTDLARVRLADGDAVGAASALEEGLEELDRWRAALPVDRLRVSAFSISRGFTAGGGVTASVVAALVREGQVARALALAERQRGRTLLENVLRAESFLLARESGSGDLMSRVPRPSSADEIRAALPGGTAAMLMVTGGPLEPSTALMLTRDTLVAVALPAVGVLSPPLERFASGLRSGIWLEDPAEELSRSVAAPILKALPRGIRTLVWVPDGPLHALPLDALWHPEGGRVLDRVAVARVPSLSVLVALLRRTPVADGRVVALADPGREGGEAGRLRMALDVDRLPALPGSRREAQRVSRLGRPGRVLRGEAASEAAIRDIVDLPVGVLHLATHAIVDPDTPARTALVLAPGGGEDGLLTPAELGALGLRADLVVLSACTTAGGLNLRGEGVQGLVAPLLGGGARTTVATGWEIPDRMPVPLMEAFYGRLTEGLPVAEAMRQAKQEAIARGASPAVWAAFQVVGDPGVSPVLHSRPSLPPPAGGLILLVAASALLAFGRSLRSRMGAT